MAEQEFKQREGENLEQRNMLQDRLDRLQARLAKKDEDYDALTQRLAQHKADAQAAADRAVEAGHERDQRLRAAEKRVEELDRRLRAAEVENLEIREELKNSEAVLAANQQLKVGVAVAALRCFASELLLPVRRLQQESLAVQQQLKRAQITIEELDASNKKLREQCDKVVQENTALRSQVLGLEGKLDAASRRSNMLDKGTRSWADGIVDLRRQLEEAKRAAADHPAQQAERAQQIEALKAELGRTRARLEDAGLRLDDADKEEKRRREEQARLEDAGTRQRTEAAIKAKEHDDLAARAKQLADQNAKLAGDRVRSALLDVTPARARRSHLSPVLRSTVLQDALADQVRLLTARLEIFSGLDGLDMEQMSNMAKSNLRVATAIEKLGTSIGSARDLGLSFAPGSTQAMGAGAGAGAGSAGVGTGTMRLEEKLGVPQASGR